MDESEGTAITGLDDQPCRPGLVERLEDRTGGRGSHRAKHRDVDVGAHDGGGGEDFLRQRREPAQSPCHHGPDPGGNS